MSMDLRTNKQGRDLIRSFENVGLTAVKDDHGCWVVGFGHSERVHEGLSISQEQADGLFRLDLERVEGAVRRVLHTPVNRNEFSALVSIAYDVGLTAFEASDVLYHVNAGNQKAAGDAILRMIPGDVTQAYEAGSGIAKRRTAEASLFASPPPLEVTDAPVSNKLERAARKLAHPGPMRTVRPWVNASRLRVLPALALAVLLSGFAVVREAAVIADLGNLDSPLLSGLIDTIILWPRTAHLLMALLVFAGVAYASFVVLRALKD